MAFKGENNGFLPFPPEALARMTPEQRKEREAAVAKQLEPRVFKQCVTQHDVDVGLASFEKNGMSVCAETVVSDTPTLRAEHLQCTSPMALSIDYRLETPTPDSLASLWNMTSPAAADGRKMSGEMHGKWLGPDCGDVQPENR